MNLAQETSAMNISALSSSTPTADSARPQPQRATAPATTPAPTPAATVAISNAGQAASSGDVNHDGH